MSSTPAGQSSEQRDPWSRSRLGCLELGPAGGKSGHERCKSGRTMTREWLLPAETCECETEWIRAEYRAMVGGWVGGWTG
eukprot:1110109-Rhodomonas_salina.1